MNSALLILSADLLLALSFVFQKSFEKRFGSAPLSASVFMLASGSIKTLFYALLCLIRPDSRIAALLSPFSIGLATLQALLVTAYTLIGFLLLKSGGMTLYTLFLMAGGMTLPYLYGVLALDEPLTVLRLLGLACIVGALVLYNACADGKKIRSDARTNLLCVAVFVLNGFVSIVSKRHQIETLLPTADTNGFALWTALAGTVCSTLLFLILKKKQRSPLPIPRSSFLPLASAGAALAGGLSYLLQLAGAVSLPATVLYPAVTGGSILCSALADCLAFKSRPNAFQWSGLALAIVGTCMFL